MLADRKVTSLVPISLVIPELSVHLHGKGNHALVNSESASKSPTLQEYIRKGWVRLDTIPRIATPFWPFYSAPKELPSSTHNISAQPFESQSGDVLSEIRDLLKTFVERQLIPAAPVIPPGLSYTYQAPSITKPALDEIPKFIPSKIMPEKVEVVIKSTSHESEKDTDSALSALRRLKKQ